MSEPATAPSLRVNFGWLLVGRSVYAASQWGILVALAKLGSTSLVGYFALGLAVTAPVSLLFNLQLRSVLATDVGREYRFRDYLVLRLLCSAAALAVIAGIAGIFRADPLAWKVILGIGVAKAIESTSDIFHGLMIQRERQDLLARALLIRGPLSLLSVLGVLAFGGSLPSATVGLFLSWLAVLLGYELPRGRALLAAREEEPAAAVATTDGGSPRTRLLLRLSTLALPLGIAESLTSLKPNIPKYFLQTFGGPDDLGVYSALAYFIVAGSLVVTALQQSALPRLAAYWREDRIPAFRSLVVRMSGVAALLGGAGVAVAWLGGPLLLGAVYTEEYARHAGEFVFIMLAGALSYLSACLGCGIVATRRFGYMLAMLLAAIVTTVVCGSIWIPAHGPRGAAWTLSAASTLQWVFGLVVLYLLVRRKERAT